MYFAGWDRAWYLRLLNLGAAWQCRCRTVRACLPLANRFRCSTSYFVHSVLILRAIPSNPAVSKRIKATKNVAKLTNVMKLVASAKLKAVEQALAEAKPFGASLMESVAHPALEYAGGDDELPLGEPVPGCKRLVVVMTTDRGLCGSVNSSSVRYARNFLEARIAAGEEISLFMLGEKSRSQLGRDYSELAVHAIDQCFDKDPIFSMASSVAERILQHDFDELTIFYNEFINAASFKNRFRTFSNMSKGDGADVPERFEGFELEPESPEVILPNLMEYSVSGALFYTMLENQTCEVSQRVTSMDNATTNAQDMVDRFTLMFNRARQARITTELTEIISGAESLKEE